MRYREGGTTEQLARHASDDMLIFTAVLSLFIAFILLWLGRKGKQQWLVVWSIGLVICSVGMGAYLLAEKFKLFPV